MQESDDVAPVVLLLVPSGHSTQAADPCATPKVPCGHSKHCPGLEPPDADKKEPLGQAEQNVAPSTWLNVPGKHCEHPCDSFTAAGLVPNFPAGQGTQEVAPVADE